MGNDLGYQCMHVLICWYELCDLFENCMLIDMIVQMMHENCAWFKMHIWYVA